MTSGVLWHHCYYMHIHNLNQHYFSYPVKWRERSWRDWKRADAAGLELRRSILLFRERFRLMNGLIGGEEEREVDGKMKGRTLLLSSCHFRNAANVGWSQNREFIHEEHLLIIAVCTFFPRMFKGWYLRELLVCILTCTVCVSCDQGSLVDYLRSRGRTVLGGDCLLKFSLWVTPPLLSQCSISSTTYSQCSGDVCQWRAAACSVARFCWLCNPEQLSNASRTSMDRLHAATSCRIDLLKTSSLIMYRKLEWDFEKYTCHILASDIILHAPIASVDESRWVKPKGQICLKEQYTGSPFQLLQHMHR